MNELALFAGIGGGILGGKLLGWRTVCAVEINPFCREILMQRQDDGILDPFPIWDDVQTFDGKPWRGLVDVVSGGFPCQDISIAGKGAGIEGERSGMWREMARIIREVRPSFALVENSPALTHRGLGNVLGDLAAMGYNARWGVLGANAVGLPHLRKRIWILASNAYCNRLQGRFSRRATDRSNSNQLPALLGSDQYPLPRPKTNGVPDPGISGKNHGISRRVDRTVALGNAQVPAVAALAVSRLENPK